MRLCVVCRTREDAIDLLHIIYEVSKLSLIVFVVSESEIDDPLISTEAITPSKIQDTVECCSE